MTSSNGNIFRVTVLCAGNSLTTGEFHKDQWREALIFALICAFVLRLSKQLRHWWFETPWHSLWRHCNTTMASDDLASSIVSSATMVLIMKDERVLTIYGKYLTARVISILRKYKNISEMILAWVWFSYVTCFLTPVASICWRLLVKDQSCRLVLIQARGWASHLVCHGNHTQVS